ncbi:hypothetical protein AAFF_G00270600 [Aldrovandia affinis]|uniref:Gypsy retrotransposon integrase-like protein 1 n=1 Tax=Aldrovandia affinis TaxID=143900 RepID=A0AAD7RB09_9TELE|nr:hypothetical protein AAFF_G00270600 [Aldrovandia affinis]
MSFTGDWSVYWDIFRAEYEDYVLVTGTAEKDKKIQAATLRSVMGSECRHVYRHNLNLSVAGTGDPAVILDELEKYFKPAKNTIYERYIFGSCKQEEGESIDNFVMRLRERAATCEYGQLKDEMIRDKIVLGIANESIRRRLLREKGLTLITAIEMCRAAEQTDIRMRAMEISSPPHTEAVHAVAKQHSRKQTPILSNKTNGSRATHPEPETQCKLDYESSLMTTFWTPWGRKRWLKLPFGVSVAPEVYQRKQHELLAGLKGIEPIADDILVVGCGDTDKEAESDHDAKLVALMERCREVKLRLGLKKLQFKVAEVQFHGHILSSAGLKPDLEKIEKECLSKIATTYTVPRDADTHRRRSMLPCRAPAQETLYWPNMQTEIKDFVSTCSTCNVYAHNQQKETMLSHDLPTRPWQILSMDMFAHRQKDYLLIVDHYSDFWEIELLPDMSAETVIKRCKAQFARHGQPERVITVLSLPLSSRASPLNGSSSM